MIWTGIVSLIAATCIWHVGDANMLHAFDQGRRTEALLWVVLHVLSVPLFAFSSYAFFRYQRSWWVVELPYVVAGMVTSVVLFNRVLRVSISWREATATGLVLLAGYLVSSAPSGPEPPEVPSISESTPTVITGVIPGASRTGETAHTTSLFGS